MNLTDTHTHLYSADFAEDITQVMRASIAAGVTQCFLPNIDSATVPAMLQLCRQYPDHCFPMLGLHPCYVKKNYREELTGLQSWLDKEKFYAIGEIGMDFHWDNTFVKEQEEAFRVQLAWASEKNLPVVIHSRKAFDTICDILEDPATPRVRGVFHCFAEGHEQAQRAIALGFYLGIGGVLTYKNSGLVQVIEKIPLRHIVLETDAPYLPPAPFRGKRNESAYLVHVARKLAEVMRTTLAEVAEVTTRNASTLFGV